ncbi:MAG: LptF/LptG family permease [Verrucomicrobia bacterium]|nr:LptF/LptG family permease [Verrucomicrobiota bacterium]
MRISDRYIGKQVLLGTLFAVLVLSLVLVLGNLFKQIRPLLVDKHAPLWLVLRFVLNVLPFSLMFTIPWGFLSAVLLVFGRLSTDHEIISFRVAGVGLARLVVPVFVIAAVLSAACLWLNVNVVPKAKASLTELLFEQAKRDPRALLSPGMVHSGLKDVKFFVEDQQENALLGLHLYRLPENAAAEAPSDAYLHATRFTFVVDDGNQELRLKLYDASFETLKPDGTVDTFSAEEAEPYLIPFGASTYEKTKAPAMTNQEIVAYLARHPELTPERRVKYHIEVAQRFSFSMACLAFAFIAVPLGMQSRRKDSSSGLLISLLLGTGYFLFTILAAESKSNAGATLALWLPNVICVGVGLFLFRRAQFK